MLLGHHFFQTFGFFPEYSPFFKDPDLGNPGPVHLPFLRLCQSSTQAKGKDSPAAGPRREAKGEIPGGDQGISPGRASPGGFALKLWGEAGSTSGAVGVCRSGVEGFLLPD